MSILRMSCIMILISSVTGCSATGKPYKNFVQEWRTLDKNDARLIFYKPPKKDPFGVLSKASYSINNEPKGTVMWEGFNMIDVKPGPTTLAVSQVGGIGSCRAVVNLEPGKEYFFRIDNRSGQAVATLLFGLVGAIAESTSSECGGAYKFDQVEPAVGRAEVADLRLTM